MKSPSFFPLLVSLHEEVARSEPKLCHIILLKSLSLWHWSFGIFSPSKKSYQDILDISYSQE